MKRIFLFPGFILLLIAACGHDRQPARDFRDLALEKKPYLRLSTYITAQTVHEMFSTEPGKMEVLSLLNCYGITKVYLEVYRGGLVLPPDLIRQSVQFLKSNGFEVTGGIATVPGEGFGMPQEGPLEWFNWQNPKTQDDLRRVMEQSAPFFDSFIVDDFLCTSDTSLESKNARGDRSWPEYRRSLLTRLAADVLINPAKEKSPGIRMIIKYPQWYDRFHLFGYDVTAGTKLFDGVWVGTESRGQYTQRFGFVQPYQGFINFRWLSSVAGEKTGGAWFDHEDCTDQDFIDQAYQSVLAGATEIIIFSFDSFITGHPGHHLLMQEFENLASLAETVADHPVAGPAGYKPPESDAGGDLYIFDYIGMMGISLVPVSSFPENARVIFLPEQAAADTAIYGKIVNAKERGARIIMTTGFIASSGHGQQLAGMAGIKWPVKERTEEFETIVSGEKEYKLTLPLKTGFSPEPDGAEVIMALSGATKNPFLLFNRSMNTYVMNTHTFSQADFDAVGEVLLCPAPLGLTELPAECAGIIRDAFAGEGDPEISAPARVTVQELAGAGFVIQNYNQAAAHVKLKFTMRKGYIDGFTGSAIPASDDEIHLEMNPRSLIWLKPSAIKN